MEGDEEAQVSSSSGNSSAPISLKSRVLAASFSSVVSALVVNPIDVVKTRMQAQAASHSYASSAGGVEQAATHPCQSRGLPIRSGYVSSSGGSRVAYISALRSMQALKQKLFLSAAEGAAAAAPGTLRACTCMSLAAATLGLDAAGAAGTGCSSSGSISRAAFRAPGMLPTLRLMLQQEGTRALWRGLDSALLMSVPGVLIYYPMYDVLLAKLQGSSTGSALSPGSTGSMSSSAGAGTGSAAAGSVGEGGTGGAEARGWGLGHAGPMVSGAIARSVAVFAVAPLDLIRTRQQAGPLAGPAAAPPPLPQAAPAAAAGPAAAGAQSVAQTMPGSRVAQSAASLVRGLPRMWAGFGATLARDVPFSALYWGMVEPLRAVLLLQLQAQGQGQGQQQRHASQQAHLHVPPSDAQLLVANLVAGSLAGAVAAAATTPFDVIKTRLQIQGAAAGTGASSELATASATASTSAGAGAASPWGQHHHHHQRSIGGMARQVLAESGWRGLWVGTVPRAARCAPACALVIAGYELLKRYC